MAGDQNSIDIEATLDTTKVRQGKTDIEGMLAETKRMLEDLDASTKEAAESASTNTLGAFEGAFEGGLLGGLFSEGAARMAEVIMEPLIEALSDIAEETSRVVHENAQIDMIGETYHELAQNVEGATSAFKQLSEWQQRTALGLGEGEHDLQRYYNEITRLKKEMEDFEKSSTGSMLIKDILSGVPGGEMAKQIGRVGQLESAKASMEEAVEADKQRREDEFFESRNNAQRFRAEEDQKRGEEKRQQADDKWLEKFYAGFDKAGEQIARAEAREFEKQLAANEKFASNRRSGHGLGESKEEFRSSVETDAMEVSRHMLAGNFSPHEQKMQAFEEKAAQQREVTNTIMAENLQNGRDVLHKLENMDGGLVA